MVQKYGHQDRIRDQLKLSKIVQEGDCMKGTPANLFC